MQSKIIISDEAKRATNAQMFAAKKVAEKMKKIFSGSTRTQRADARQRRQCLNCRHAQVIRIPPAKIVVGDTVKRWSGRFPIGCFCVLDETEYDDPRDGINATSHKCGKWQSKKDNDKQHRTEARP